MKKLKYIIVKKGLDLAKKSTLLRQSMRWIVNSLKRCKYLWNTRGILVEEKTILFSAFNGKSYTCTPKAVYEYMLSNPQYKDYTYLWVVSDLNQYAYLTQNPNTALVLDKGKTFDQALARAKYWIFNSRIYDYVKPKKNQVYVQCWHGTPLKKLGYDIQTSNNVMNSIKEICEKYRTDAKRFRYLLSPSPFATEKFTSAWNLKATKQEGKIIEVGYPRNDFLLNHTPEDARNIKKQLGIAGDKKVILYAPTWRDNQHVSGTGYTYANTVDFHSMREQLGKDWVVLFRAHYFIASRFDFEEYKGFVYNVSDYDDINQLYVISDLLITDYSSVFFDYANLHRPMIFYMYDLEEYKNDLRGFYIDLNQLPGPIVKNQEELMAAIEQVEDTFVYDEIYQAFNATYNCLDDGKASERFTKAILM